MYHRKELVTSLRGGFGFGKFGKVIFEIIVDQIPPPYGQTFGGDSGPPCPSMPTGQPCPFLGIKYEYLNVAQNQASKYSTCSSQCPEHEDNFLFEIGHKMTKLRANTLCPNMGASANFGHFCAIRWPNINIFQWDLGYMICTPKLHHTSKFQFKSY